MPALRPDDPALRAEDVTPALRLSFADLFIGFAKIGLSGFGGVMPFARRALVEDRRWLTSSEFTSLLGISQFLPGANVGNLAICVGSRFGGWLGAVAAFSGLLAGPFCLILVLGALYDRFGDVPLVQHVLTGIAVAGAGLILSTGLKMGSDLLKRPDLFVIALATALAIGVFELRLPYVIAVVAPAALVAASLRIRRDARVALAAREAVAAAEPPVTEVPPIDPAASGPSAAGSSASEPTVDPGASGSSAAGSSASGPLVDPAASGASPADAASRRPLR